MQELIKSNKGFQSRINFYIDFPDYSPNELFTIIDKMVEKEHYILDKNCKDVMIEFFTNEMKTDNFSNGRLARNLFEKVKMEQANRITNTNSNNLDIILKEDITNAVNKLKTKDTKKVIGFAN